MGGRLRALWQNLIAGFWLVPGAVATVIAASAFLFVEIDRAAGVGGIGIGFDGDAGAARDILSTIAGSLITVAGLTFSMTIVVLTLISSQFTPRALRGFLGDRVNQVVAGAFVGIFLYCLIVLRSVRGGGDGDAFVPALSVTVAIALGLLTLVLLLLFVHHMGRSIQASHIAARIARQTLAAVDRLYPERYSASSEEDPEEIVPSWLEDGKPASVTPARAGYVLLVDLDSILKAAAPGARLQVAVRPGDFVTEEDVLARMWPADRLEEARAPLRRSIPVEDERDLHQDVSYGLQQLTDIALKALSPGINDPTTAVTCIGYLRAVLERLARRAIPGAVRRLDDAIVVAEQRSFEEYADSAFSEIGRYASDNARVVLVLLAAVRSVGCIARSVGAVGRVPALAEIGEAIAGPALEGASATRDERLIRCEIERLREAFGGKPRRRKGA